MAGQGIDTLGILVVRPANETGKSQRKNINYDRVTGGWKGARDDQSRDNATGLDYIDIRLPPSSLPLLSRPRRIRRIIPCSPMPADWRSSFSSGENFDVCKANRCVGATLWLLARLSLPLSTLLSSSSSPSPFTPPLFFLFSLCRSLYVLSRRTLARCGECARSFLFEVHAERQLNGMAQMSLSLAACEAKEGTGREWRTVGCKRGLRRVDRLQADTRKRMPVRSLSISLSRAYRGVSESLLPNFEDTRYSSDKGRAVSIERDRFLHTSRGRTKENAINVQDVLRI